MGAVALPRSLAVNRGALAVVDGGSRSVVTMGRSADNTLPVSRLRMRYGEYPGFYSREFVVGCPTSIIGLSDGTLLRF